MKYIYYSAEDFALDPSFRRWVQHPEERVQGILWEEWLARHPEKIPEVEKGRQLVELLTEEFPGLADGEKRLLWGQIQDTLAAGQEEVTTNVIRPQWKGAWRGAAAVVLLLMASLSAWQWFSDQTVRVETAFGATRRLLLPDSSVVILNGNSALSYAPVWQANKPREVWLEGEAFFDVAHKQAEANAPFLVHTKGLTVEVLGTRFNVSQREAGARVVLTDGKVKLDIGEGAGKPGAGKLYMRAGEVVELSAHSRKITRKVANPDLYTSWRNHELVFDETPLAQIARVLEDTYGRKVVFKKPALAQYRISGTIPSDNVDILLSALAKSSNIRIEQQDNTVLVDTQ